MKRLRYRTKTNNEIPLENIPQGFTPTHVYEYKIVKGKMKAFKKKLTKSEIKKLSK